MDVSEKITFFIKEGCTVRGLAFRSAYEKLRNQTLMLKPSSNEGNANPKTASCITIPIPNKTNPR